MKPLHVFAALLIVAMWGLNFTVIRYGLDEYTPFTFATWRFLLAALPVLFVKKPAIPWVTLAGIGGFMFGYDSGVINGTQEGLKSTFNPARRGSASRSAPCCPAVRSAPSRPAGQRTALAGAASCWPRPRCSS